MEFAAAMPTGELFSEGTTKRPLRTGFAHRLPASIVNNHKKIGFATPFEQWSRVPAYRSFVGATVQSPEFLSRRIWNGRKLAAVLQDPEAVVRGFPAWRFLNAELWVRNFGITNV
jgi:asparagine synthetase B (glutamine-hydrolysing)